MPEHSTVTIEESKALPIDTVARITWRDGDGPETTTALALRSRNGWAMSHDRYDRFLRDDVLKRVGAEIVLLEQDWMPGWRAAIEWLESYGTREARDLAEEMRTRFPDA